MTEATPDLPDWSEEEISINNDYDVQDHFFVEPLVETDRPWLSREAIEDEVGVSDQNARDRLGRLVEKGVLARAPAANGDIYWIKDERSRWPIPPDIELAEPEGEGGVEEEDQKRTTIDDLLDRTDVRMGIATVMVAVISSVLIGVGVAPLLGGYEVAWIGRLADISLVIGFFAALLATGMIGVTLFMFGAQKIYHQSK